MAEQNARTTFMNKTQDALDQINVDLNEKAQHFNAIQEVKENIDSVANKHDSLADQISSLDLPNLKT